MMGGVALPARDDEAVCMVGWRMITFSNAVTRSMVCLSPTGGFGENATMMVQVPPAGRLTGQPLSTITNSGLRLLSADSRHGNVRPAQ